MLVTQKTREFHQTHVNISMPTFPLHLFLLMTFRAYSLPVDLSTHSRTTAKFPSPKVLPTLYLSVMETGTEEGSSISSAVEKHKIGRVKIEMLLKILIRFYLHCQGHRLHPWSCKPLWRLKKVKNHYAGIPEGKREF